MIYFDNSATTKPYKDVLDAFLKVNSEFYGNPSSLHNWGSQAEGLISYAREQIAGMVGVKPGEILFTSGGTEGNNLAIKGAALGNRSKGDHIITTNAEHPSVFEACEQLKELGFQVTYIPVDEQGKIRVADVAAALTEKTILVSIIHVNNEVGTIQPIEEIGRLLSQRPQTIFHVDHVQGAGKVRLNLTQSHIDLCTFSSHKFHGLKGNGFIYVRNGLKLKPLLTGGGQERGLRSGTENTGGIVGMAKAFRLTSEKEKTESGKLAAIRDYLFEQLSSMDDIAMHTPFEGAAPHIINFSVAGQKGEVLVHALEEEGIIVSTTSACSSKNKSASATLKAMGLSNEEARSAIRISLSYENTMEEAEEMIRVLKRIIQRLNQVTRRRR